MQAVELRMGVNRVGRDPECELQLNHSTISSLHCELSLSVDGVYLHDCNSTNGTFLNGTRLVAHRPYPVKDGDEIRLGQMVLRVYFQSNKTRK